MAIMIMTMQELSFADASYFPDAFRYWLCDTDAEVTVLGSGKAHEGDLAYTKESDKLYFRTGSAWVEAGGTGGGGDLLSTNNLSDLADVATARTNLGLGSAAVESAAAFDAAGTASGLVTTHEADSTNVHGIADTSVLLTTSTKLDDLAAPDDNTDLDASTTKHGLMMKYPGGSTNFLREDGTWQPAGGGSGLTHPQVMARTVFWGPF